MNREYSLSYRLNILVLIVALAIGATGCVNKAQQKFERPPAPVTVAPAVRPDLLVMMAKPKIARATNEQRKS